MNVVMYPEITGDSKPKQSDDDPNRYNANALADIVTLVNTAEHRRLN